MIAAGARYVDMELIQSFEVLDVGADTLRVRDDHGEVRTVNRALFERDMVKV